MIKKNSKHHRILMNETGSYNAFVDGMNRPEKRSEFTGQFWPAQCFTCPKKRTEALSSFLLKVNGHEGAGDLDLRTCKVCVKYAMRLSETRKTLENLERFFQVKK